MAILQITSDTLAVSPTSGQLEYNGQYFGTDSGSSRAQFQRIGAGTSQASTSGTNIDFTGIPSWINRITILFGGVSTTGASVMIVQLGISSGFETTGYVGTGAQYSNGNTTSVGSVPASGFGQNATASGDVVYGSMNLTNISGNTWICTAVMNNSSTVMANITGQKTLAGVLDRIRITTVLGTPTFDAGSINILYEG